MATFDKKLEFSDFDRVFSDRQVGDAMRRVSPTAYDAAAGFWKVPFVSDHLTPRMKELILFAMNVSATSLNVDAVRRQIRRIELAGGTPEDILDVLITIASLANHSVYASVPVLEEEWAAAGKESRLDAASTPELLSAKEHFIKVRGFWNKDRDPIDRQMPAYALALSQLATESWQRGTLTRRERELVCIGIDCTVTHTYTPGLRIHIRNAIREGAAREEILEVFQLAALMGLEGYIITAEAMFGANASSKADTDFR